MGSLLGSCQDSCLNLLFPVLMFDVLLRWRVVLSYSVLQLLNLWLCYYLYQRLPGWIVLWLVLALLAILLINTVYFFIGVNDLKEQIEQTKQQQCKPDS